MKTLTTDRLFLAGVLLNIICCLVLLSEGHTLFGLVILTVGILLCAILTFRSWAFNESNIKQDDNEAVHSFAYYMKAGRSEWLENNTSLISNQSVIMIVFRIVFVLSIVIFCILSLIYNNISYFRGDIIFDKLMFVLIILFAAIYLIFGFRFCAFPAFVAYSDVMLVYFIHLSYHKALEQSIYHNLITYFLITTSFVILLYWAYRVYKKGVYYFNIEKYEREDVCCGVDLFVNLFMPLKGYERLFSSEIQLIPVQEYSLDDYVKRIIKIAHENEVVFAGYEKPNDKDTYTLLFYLPEDNAFSNEFKEAYNSFLKKENIYNQTESTENDAEWEKYSSLYPNNSELCEIISRKHIETLFMDGTSFDREYELSFFVNFSNKTDPVEFEDRIKYFGFTLAYASFCQDHEISSNHYYIGEYKTKSYISVRRIEYLNSLLLRESQDYGALYFGEWEVEYEVSN